MHNSFGLERPVVDKLELLCAWTCCCTRCARSRANFDGVESYETGDDRDAESGRRTETHSDWKTRANGNC